ncbi:MAG: helix-turn-helix domain-containing protein [Actinomycetota bacterium]
MVERILDEAARIFVERGYAATTTNDVAASADVSIGSLYQYFPNKDALLVGLAERHLDDAIPAFDALSAQLRAESPDLDHLVRAFVAAAHELNQPEALHELLWRAPRTDALLATLSTFEATMAAEVEWHLRRLGHDDERVATRARLVVEIVEVGVHGPPDPARTDELTALLTTALAR